MIYFDSAASYPVLPEVQQVLQHSFSELYGNSTASHKLGLEANSEIDKARALIAETIGALNSEIVFTSGATESNNLALKGMLLDNPQLKDKRHIVTSEIEHKCILAICNYLRDQHGFAVTYIAPNNDGIITKQGVEEALQDNTALVSVMHVNNELGTINPIGEIGALCFEKGILFHSDAAQSFCKVPIDVDDLNIDIMSFSAHKIGGPKGIGGLYIRDLRKQKLSPVIHGAGQEEGVRGGTVAAPIISGFAAAIEFFPSYYNKIEELNLKANLLNSLRRDGIEYRINGGVVDSLNSILSIELLGVDLALLIRATENTFALAQGSACSSKQIEPSHVLTSLGLGTDSSGSTLRISFSHVNTLEDITLLVDSIKTLKR